MEAKKTQMVFLRSIICQLHPISITFTRGAFRQPAHTFILAKSRRSLAANNVYCLEFCLQSTHTQIIDDSTSFRYKPNELITLTEWLYNFGPLSLLTLDLSPYLCLSGPPSVSVSLDWTPFRIFTDLHDSDMLKACNFASA